MKEIPITFKEKGFAKEYIKEKGNQTKAAKKVYNVKNDNTAAVIGSTNIRKPKVREEIDRLLEESGITKKLLITRLKQGLNSKTLTNYKGQVQQTDIPDITERRKHLDIGLKLEDMYPSQKIDQRTLNIDVELESMTDREIEQLLRDELKQIGSNAGKKED